jgi:hypothetical protein
MVVDKGMKDCQVLQCAKLWLLVVRSSSPGRGLSLSVNAAAAALLHFCWCVIVQYEKIIAEIEQIGGVVTHGLLLNVADAVVIADQKAGVTVVKCEKQQPATAAS